MTDDLYEEVRLYLEAYGRDRWRTNEIWLDDMVSRCETKDEYICDLERQLAQLQEQVDKIEEELKGDAQVELWLNSIGAEGFTNLIRVRDVNATVDETVEVPGAIFHPRQLRLTERPTRCKITIEIQPTEGSPREPAPSEGQREEKGE